MNQKRFLDIIKIDAFDIPDSWFQLLKACLEKGYEYRIEEGASVGDRRKELDFVWVRIKYPGNRPIIPDVPLGIPPPTSYKFVYEYMEVLVTSLGKADYDYTYGERLEAQIPLIIERLKQTENTNQTCMEVGKPEDINLENPPCLRLIDVRRRYGKLHFFCYFRSWDLWGGYPTNVAGLQLLKEYMAREIGIEDGEMLLASKGLHLYSREWELAEKVISPKSLEYK
jgi:thymidylate synthase